MEQSRHFLFVVVTCTLHVIFQDASYWLTKHPESYFSYCIKQRIVGMRSDEKRQKLKDFIMKGSAMVEKIEKAHEEMLKESTAREVNINQHMSKLFFQNDAQLSKMHDSILDGNNSNLEIE